MRKKRPSKDFQPSRRKQKLINDLERIRQARRRRPPEERLKELRGSGLETQTFKDPLTGKMRSVWEEIERDVRFGGEEWQIALPPDYFEEVAKLERQGKYREARLFEWQTLETLVIEHFQKNQRLLDVLVEHPDLVHSWTAWIAVRFWTDNQAVCRWLMEDVVPNALRDFSPRSPTLSREDLKQEAAAGLAKALVGNIRKIRGKIRAYLSAIARNAALAYIKKFPPGRSLDEKVFREGEQTQKDLLQDETSLEDLRLVLDSAISAREWGRLKDHLTPREWFLVTHANTPRAQQAESLNVGERQIRRDINELRKKAERILKRK